MYLIDWYHELNSGNRTLPKYMKAVLKNIFNEKRVIDQRRCALFEILVFGYSYTEQRAFIEPDSWFEVL